MPALRPREDGASNGPRKAFRAWEVGWLADLTRTEVSGELSPWTKTTKTHRSTAGEEEGAAFCRHDEEGKQPRRWSLVHFAYSVACDPGKSCIWLGKFWWTETAGFKAEGRRGQKRPPEGMRAWRMVRRRA